MPIASGVTALLALSYLLSFCLFLLILDTNTGTGAKGSIVGGVPSYLMVGGLVLLALSKEYLDTEFHTEQMQVRYRGDGGDGCVLCVLMVMVMMEMVTVMVVVWCCFIIPITIVTIINHYHYHYHHHHIHHHHQ